MPIYVYEGKNPAGKKVSGEVEVRTTDELYRWFRANRVTVTTVKKKRKELSFKIGTGIRLGEIANFSRQFAVMIGAGLPLSQCLAVMANQVDNKHFKKVLRSVAHNVESGSTLADSLIKYRNIFGDLFIHMVEAGELGGVLDVILRRVATYLEKTVALRRKIKGALMYPLVISVVAVVAVTFMLVFIIPVFAGLFADFDAELPGPTKVVLFLSNILQHNFVYIIIGLVLLVVGYKFVTRKEKGRLIRDKIFLSLPVFGPVVLKTAISRFARTLETLLASGVAIIEALNITAKSSGNMVIEKTVKKMAERIAGGQTISEPLKESGVFPPMVVQMVAVGEQTGEVDVMLGKVADFYEDEVDTAVQSMTSVLEPIMIVILGTVVGGMLIAMYLPMFDLIGAVK
jgi:type IV pilus assembly protein PilC